MDSETLRRAYDRTDFEMVVATPALEVPTATPAVFTIADPPAGSADDVLARLEGEDWAFVTPYTEDGPDGGIFLSAKVYDAETNEFVKVRANRDSIRVFPDGEDLSFETFRRFVEHVGGALGTDLEVAHE